MLTPKEIEEKLKTVVKPATEGDHSLNPAMRPPETLRKAAVLILLVKKEDGLHVLFTERTAHLTSHPGQISFPGGGCEAQDKSMAETALRESAEEIGLDPKNARVIGQLSDYITRSGYIVTPVVAVLENDQQWKPDENEVAGLFDVPLDYILTKGNIREEAVSFEGKERRFFAIDWREFRIWGATAGILHNFAEILSAKAPSNDVAPKGKPPENGIL